MIYDSDGTPVEIIGVCPRDGEEEPIVRVACVVGPKRPVWRNPNKLKADEGLHEIARAINAIQDPTWERSPGQ